MTFLIATLTTLLALSGFYAFQRPFREYPGREYEKFPLPKDWQEKTEWAFARLMYPATNRAHGYGGWRRRGATTGLKVAPVGQRTIPNPTATSPPPFAA